MFYFMFYFTCDRSLSESILVSLTIYRAARQLYADERAALLFRCCR